MTELGRAFPALPDDLLNFQYDPLACAVAAGWNGVTVEELPVDARLADGLLLLSIENGAPRRRIVTDVDAAAFDVAWLEARPAGVGRMKVAVVGGGGFRTPTLHGCIVRVAPRHRDRGDRAPRCRGHPAGDDRRGDRGTRSGAWRRRRGLRTTTSLVDAVDGAGAVLVAIRVGGGRARMIDEEVPLSLGVLGQETVGPVGSPSPSGRSP